VPLNAPVLERYDGVGDEVGGVVIDVVRDGVGVVEATADEECDLKLSDMRIVANPSSWVSRRTSSTPHPDQSLMQLPLQPPQQQC
jgi:hypothetical protein